MKRSNFNVLHEFNVDSHNQIIALYEVGSKFPPEQRHLVSGTLTSLIAYVDITSVEELALQEPEPEIPLEDRQAIQREIEWQAQRKEMAIYLWLQSNGRWQYIFHIALHNIFPKYQERFMPWLVPNELPFLLEPRARIGARIRDTSYGLLRHRDQVTIFGCGFEELDDRKIFSFPSAGGDNRNASEIATLPIEGTTGKTIQKLLEDAFKRILNLESLVESLKNGIPINNTGDSEMFEAELLNIYRFGNIFSSSLASFPDPNEKVLEILSPDPDRFHTISVEVGSSLLPSLSATRRHVDVYSWKGGNPTQLAAWASLGLDFILYKVVEQTFYGNSNRLPKNYGEFMHAYPREAKILRPWIGKVSVEGGMIEIDTRIHKFISFYPFRSSHRGDCARITWDAENSKVVLVGF